jgi:hypothetical protein
MSYNLSKKTVILLIGTLLVAGLSCAKYPVAFAEGEATTTEPVATSTEPVPDTSTTTEPIATTTPTELLFPLDIVLSATSTPGDVTTTVPSAPDIPPLPEEMLVPPPAVPSADPVIVTGNAFAEANILNVVNTNIIDSEGFIAFLNIFEPLIGDISVADIEFPLDGCAGNGCDLDALVSTENDGTVVNTVTVIANTGENTAGDGGTIVTGNSAAAANVVNIVNTNIVGSNYLMLVVNSFSDWVGNLILPSWRSFASLTGSGGSGGGTVSVANGNSATIVNDTQVTAETGGNSVSGESSIIATGDAFAVSNTMTVANTNFVTENSAIILVRVFGNWSGNVLGLPPGVSWRRTADGIALYSTPAYAEGATCCGGDTDAANTNSATVSNAVRVYALTGENEVQGDGAVATGDAVAVSNVLNVVNTNVVGRNWLLAMANIFGSWEGDLVFGQPDLWVATEADLTRNPLRAGSEVAYTLTVTNRGDVPATGITLTSAHDPFVRVSVADLGGGETEEGGVRWTLPDLPAGGSATVRYRAVVTDELPMGMSVFRTNVAVLGTEVDANASDNTDSLDLTIQGPDYPGWAPEGNKNEFGYGFPEVSLAKTSDAGSVVSAPGTVRYNLRILNDGSGTAFDAVVSDTLYDPLGNVIASNTWPLDALYPRDEVRIDYDAVFSSKALTGTYVNVARLTAGSQYGGWSLDTSVSSTIYIDNPLGSGTEPQVLGEATSTETRCSEYLTDYLWKNRPNHRALVEKLQVFLNDHEGAGLPVTGYYGTLTRAAVATFQTKYATDVLAPWGITEPTGITYKTTRWKINSLMCATLDLPVPDVR